MSILVDNTKAFCSDHIIIRDKKTNKILVNKSGTVVKNKEEINVKQSKS